MYGKHNTSRIQEMQRAMCLGILAQITVELNIER